MTFAEIPEGWHGTKVLVDPKSGNTCSFWGILFLNPATETATVDMPVGALILNLENVEAITPKAH